MQTFSNHSTALLMKHVTAVQLQQWADVLGLATKLLLVLQHVFCVLHMIIHCDEFGCCISNTLDTVSVDAQFGCFAHHIKSVRKLAQTTLLGTVGVYTSILVYYGELKHTLVPC